MQLYIFVSKKDPPVEIRAVQQCTNAIYDWLSHNGLALNPAKSEAIKISVGLVQQNSVPIDTISVYVVSIKPVDSVKKSRCRHRQAPVFRRSCGGGQ